MCFIHRQFSQTSTNTLQSTLSTLKTRHAATLSTLTSTSYSLASNLRSAEDTIERLRTSLDELGRDIMKEAYGRRREVALRVKSLGREEKMLEGLRRWLRKGEEAASDSENEAENGQSRVRAALQGMTQDARILLESLDDGLVTDSASLSGSLARVVLAQELVDGLVEELKMETLRRMDLEKAILQEGQATGPPIVSLNNSDINQRPLVSDDQESSPNAFTSLPHVEVSPIHPPKSQLDEEQQSTADSAPIDHITLGTPNITKDDPIPPDSTDDTVNAATEHSPLPFYPDTLTTNQASNTVSFESSTAAESPPIDVQLTLSSSIPAHDTVIDADAAQPPHICAEIPNSVIEEAGIDKQPESVVVPTEAAFQDIDLLVEPSSVPTVVELGSRVEFVIDDSVSSASPHPPSNLQSVVDLSVLSNPVTSLPTVSSTDRTEVASQDIDLLVGPSSVPTVVELGPRVELAIDDSVSSASPHPPSNLQSVVDLSVPSNPETSLPSVPSTGRTEVAFQDIDLLVEPSSVPTVVELGPRIELAIDDSVSSASPHPPSNLQSVVDLSVPSNPETSLPTVPSTGRTEVAFQNIDLLVEPSSVPTVVELGPRAELAINDSVSSASPHPPSNLHSVVDLSVPSNPVASLPTVPSTGQPSVLAEKEEPKISSPHPLLADLSKISHRYDEFQRAFRDCHLALEGLKASLGLSSSTSSLTRQFNRPTGGKPPKLTLTRTSVIPADVLRAAVSRLDDYTEDVRVEVEIRISDEEVLAKGYEVLLCVPGALHSSFAPESSLLSPSLQANQPQHQLYPDKSQPPREDQDFNLEDSSSIPPTQSELEIQIQDFITGTDPNVIKAREGFSKKLEDVQHDIAVLKRTIHNPDPEMTIANGPEISSQTPTTPETEGRGWASWIRSPSGPPFSASAVTPSAKHFGGSTFGSIMTSPYRSNHSPSLSSSSNSATFVNENGSSWMQGASGGRLGGGRDDILGRLGLRVPMPIFDSTMHQPVPPSSSSSSNWGWNGLSPTMPTPMKQRSVSSTMYMLGLGAPPMMSTARWRGTSNPNTGPQKSSDPAVAVNVGVKSDNEMMLSRGAIGLVDVRRGDKLTSVEDETTDAETEEDEQDIEVE